MIGRQKYKNIQLNGKETYEKQDGKVDKNIDNTVEIHCDKTCKTVKPNNLLKTDLFTLCSFVELMRLLLKFSEFSRL
jgi:hypothetical protein